MQRAGASGTVHRMPYQGAVCHYHLSRGGHWHSPGPTTSERPLSLKKILNYPLVAVSCTRLYLRIFPGGHDQIRLVPWCRPRPASIPKHTARALWSTPQTPFFYIEGSKHVDECAEIF